MNTTQRTPRPAQASPLFDALEPRVMLSGDYDLTVGFTSVKLPEILLLQGKPISGSAKVTVSLNGADPLPKGQKVDLKLLLRPEAGDDVPLVTLVNRSLSGLNAAHPHKNFTASFKVPGAIPAGGYTLLVIADPAATGLPDGKLTETNESNNTAAAATTYSAETPVTEYELYSAVHNYYDTEDANTAGLGTAVVWNTGNMTPAGNAVVTFYAIRDGESETPLGYTRFALKLKPGEWTSVKVNLTLPRSLTDGGVYWIYARLTLPKSAAADVPTNNEADAPGTVKVYVEPLVFPAVGDKLVFFDEYDYSSSSSYVYRSGKFNDGYNDAGRYTLSGPIGGGNKVLTLTLFYYDWDLGTVVIDLDPMSKPAVKSLLNKKMIFSRYNSDAEGRISPSIYYDLSNA